MGGHCIESEDFVIVVDKWDASFLRRPGCKPHYFFLTHLHADHIKGLTSTWSRIIYTSPFNAWLLPMRRSVKPMLLKEIELNVTHTIRKTNNEVAFQVTLLDANHCPGAVMFLFQGKFGNILYTGDFRYSPRMLSYPALGPIIRNKELSVLYLDNTYAASSCKFPSRNEALKEILKIVDENPESKILIGMRQLGKEEVLKTIALHVKEKVCVSSQRLQILSKLEYEDVFTTDPSSSRIQAVDMHTITQRHTQEGSKVVSIKLTSMYECCNTEKQRGNIYVVPYSDHSSHTELMEFVGQLRPLKLYPIVQPQVPKMGGDSGVWYKMSTVNCVIPEEILQLCGPSTDGSYTSRSDGLTYNGSPPSIKFHPAPKPSVNIEKQTSPTYFDEGMDFVPAYSLASHFTNNNKARKHIKATWTRLAPKLLSPKGIKFQDSPEKISEVSSSRLMDGLEFSAGALGSNARADSTPCSPSRTEDAPADNENSLIDVPLSDGEDDLDTLTSARELGRQMQLPSDNRLVNGASGEDKKSECSSELTGVSSKPDILLDSVVCLRRTRSHEKLKYQPRPTSEKVSNDSNSDVSSSVRTTRSKGSLSFVPVVSHIVATRSSPESTKEGRACKEVKRKESFSRGSLRESPNAKGGFREAPSLYSAGNDCLSNRSVSVVIENLCVKGERKSPSKEILNSGGRNLARSSSSKMSPKRGPVLKTVTAERSRVEEDKEESGNSSVTETECGELVDPLRVGHTIPEVKVEVKEGNSVSCSNNADKGSVVVASSKKQGHSNGSFPTTTYNGFHINTTGRKRLPLSCDWNSAQEIVKKETEQALKALETLNQMKGFKTRNTGNRAGLSALRRLSADNIPTKSTMKNQNIVNSSTTPTGLRSRAASILSSMASTFSKPNLPKIASPSTSQENPSETTQLLLKSKPGPVSKGTRSTTSSPACSPNKLTPSKLTRSALKFMANSTSKTTPLKAQSTPSPASTSKKKQSTSKDEKVLNLTPTSPIKQLSPSKQEKPPNLTPVVPLKLSSSKSSPSSLSSSLSVIPATQSPPKQTPIAFGTRAKRSSPQQGKQTEVFGNVSLRVSPLNEKQGPDGGKGKQRNREDLSSDSLNTKSTSKDNKTTELLIKQPKSVVKSESRSEICTQQNTGDPTNIQLTGIDDSEKSLDTLNQGLFLTDETLASPSSQRKTSSKTSKRVPYKKPHGVNVELMKLKMGFAITQKRVKRLSLPSRLSKRESSNKSGQGISSVQSKDKFVQDWKKKISLRMRKSPTWRSKFKSPNKLRESAKRSLASILRSGRSLSSSQGYQADLEDYIDPSQKSTQEDNKTEENSGYMADIENCSFIDKEHMPQSSESKSEIEVSDAHSKIELLDRCVLNDSKEVVLNEVRRSLRHVKDDVFVSNCNLTQEKTMDKTRNVSNKHSSSYPSSKRTNTSGNNEDNDESSSSQKVTVAGISPIEKCVDKSGNSSIESSSPSRFSDRLLQRTRNILRHSSDNVLPPKNGSNILRLMADAFKKTVPSQTPTTANILSSMAENFKKLDEGAQVSPSLSIQLIPVKPPGTHQREDSSDWGVQITRVENASRKLYGTAANTLAMNLPPIPKSLSIEIIPEGGPVDSGPRKGPSPPTVTISPEVIDISSDSPGEEGTQSTIHSVPISPGPRRLPQGGTRWPKVIKPEIQSPPQAVWKEKRGRTQSSDNVIIDIQTQEDPQKVPHCPIHCTCGAASRQGTCMGTMRNLIENDADCLYEVPLSPEDFEYSGAMLALGKGWIESCFEGPEDRDEFFQSYEDILPTINNSVRHKQSKPGPLKGNPSSQKRPTQQTNVRKAYSSPKQTTSKVHQTQAVVSQKLSMSTAVVKKQSSDISLHKKTSMPAAQPNNLTTCKSFASSNAAKQPQKQNCDPKKRSSTDSESSVLLLKDIEKKIKAYNNNQSKKEQTYKTQSPRRQFPQSYAPILKKVQSHPVDVKKDIKVKEHLNGKSGKKDENEARHVKKESNNAKKRKASSSASDSPESKKPRSIELDRLVTDVGKGKVNKRYRSTVKRSLDHLMTRQKLRSDRRVKVTSSNR